MTALKFAAASALALAMAAPAFAQSQPDYQYQRPPPDYQPGQPSYQPTQQYQEQQQRYQQDQRDYQQRRDAYDANRQAYDQRRDTYAYQREGYAQAKADYDARIAAWQRARDRYDRIHGYGAYVAIYPAPVWDVARWGPLYPAQAYYPAYPAPAAGYYARNSAYVTTCRNDHSGRTAGAVLGGLAGAVLGSNLSAPGRHSENAALGGVLGAVVGGAVGTAHDRYKCDTRGPYYAYGDTIAYREDPSYRSGRYDYGYYERMRCRLAPAPGDAEGRDVRYVRVCPDADGRDRITG